MRNAFLATLALAADEARERLNALTVKGADVASVMEAIGDGLFADRVTLWAGCYRAW